MKYVLLGAVALVCAISVPVASAAWVPGSNYLISEEDATDYIESKLDHAYCTGIPRFGHRGEFPYEEFLVFDCDIELNGSTCYDWRFKAVKGSRYGMFRLVKLRDARGCY